MLIDVNLYRDGGKHAQAYDEVLSKHVHTLLHCSLTDFEFELDSIALLQRLLLIILLPLVVGNLLRRQVKRVGKFTAVRKTELKLLSSFALILIPWMKVSDSSDEVCVCRF